VLEQDSQNAKVPKSKVQINYRLVRLALGLDSHEHVQRDLTASDHCVLTGSKRSAYPCQAVLYLIVAPPVALNAGDPDTHR